MSCLYMVDYILYHTTCMGGIWYFILIFKIQKLEQL